MSYRAMIPFLMLSVLMALAQFFTQSLMYQRPLILDGQIWRLVTAHFTHTGWAHYALNLSGLWLWFMLQGTLPSAARLYSLLLALSVAISLGFWWFSPQIQWYVGFSGILYSLYAAWALQLLFSPERLIALGILLGLIAKSVWDAYHPDSLSQALIQAPVVYQAHGYGLLLAPITALWLYRQFKPA